MHNLVKSMKALSDDTRLRIINILLERECCVCEVSQALNISQTRASRNLTILYDTGFLRLRKEGPWSLYSMNTGEMPEYFSKLIEAIQLALLKDKTAAQDKERLKMANRNGLACV